VFRAFGEGRVNAAAEDRRFSLYRFSPGWSRQIKLPGGEPPDRPYHKGVFDRIGFRKLLST
jgi:hypothetical protein